MMLVRRTDRTILWSKENSSVLPFISFNLFGHSASEYKSNMLSIVLQSLLATAITYELGWILYCSYFHPLRSIPGPFLASFSRVWIVSMTARGDMEKTERALHKKHGEPSLPAFDDVVLTQYNRLPCSNSPEWSFMLRSRSDKGKLLFSSCALQYCSLITSRSFIAPRMCLTRWASLSTTLQVQLTKWS